MHPAGVATFDHREFPLDLLLECKGDRTVSVCVPARDEAATIGPIVGTVRSLLMERASLVDELVVVDDGSSDATGAVAAAEGARVVSMAPGRTQVQGAHGKGQAMARGISATSGSLVVFLDGDVEDFGAHFVVGLVGPLLVDPRVVLVKGCYERPIDGMPSGGGRVTELVGRPLIRLLFPDLAGVLQPLAGETAVRRDAVEGLVLAKGYGVEMGLLVDVAERHGPQAIAQVDLGTRTHRNRPLHELALQAADVIAAALDRAGIAYAASRPAGV